VALGVVLLGSATAAAVTLFDFPGGAAFEWALLLPLAMPAYVLAYAWTDALQYSSPLQTGLRTLLGARCAVARRAQPGRRGPAVRALPVPLCLPAGAHRAGRTGGAMMEAARLLGAPVRRRMLEVALPMARPAIAAGTALALMETLADYGVGSYFGLTTFSTGIYKAWLVMNDRNAAAQLAAVLLGGGGAAAGAGAPRAARMRFSAAGRAQHALDARPWAAAACGGRRVAVRAACAAGLCAAGGLGWAHAVAGIARSPSGACRWRVLPVGLGQLPPGGHAAVAATLLALALAFVMRRRAVACCRCWRRGCCRWVTPCLAR
jgi:iron(III) transport system permease protein